MGRPSIKAEQYPMLHSLNIDVVNSEGRPIELEAHPSFPGIRPYLSKQSNRARWGRMAVVPPDESTMHGTLISILEHIDRMERKWALR